MLVSIEIVAYIDGASVDCSLELSVFGIPGFPGVDDDNKDNYKYAKPIIRMFLMRFGIF